MHPHSASACIYIHPCACVCACVWVFVSARAGACTFACVRARGVYQGLLAEFLRGKAREVIEIARERVSHQLGDPDILLELLLARRQRGFLR
jgi:hypothetical protein